MADNLVKFGALEAKLAASEKVAEFRLLTILDAVREQLDDLIHEAGGVDEVVVVVNRLYDLYVQPIDVPWIVEPFESMLFDSAAKRVIEGVIRRVHARVHTEG